jgi:hypothetical protein
MSWGPMKEIQIFFYLGGEQSASKKEKEEKRGGTIEQKNLVIPKSHHVQNQDQARQRSVHMRTLSVQDR